MQQTATREPEVVRVSTLAGNAVVDVTGEAIGRIREVMLDVPHGRVAYLVLAFEDPAEPGDSDGPVRKLFAVPWEALRVDGASRRLVLDTDRERLRNAPGIDPEHWPSMAQPTWTSALYEFYGLEPYHGD